MREIDETGVAADAADVGYWDALLVQSFYHASNVKFGLCLATDTGYHGIVQVTAHPALRISRPPGSLD
jgi:hypothetical protein